MCYVKPLEGPHCVSRLDFDPIFDFQLDCNYPYFHRIKYLPLFGRIMVIYPSLVGLWLFTPVWSDYGYLPQFGRIMVIYPSLVGLNVYPSLAGLWLFTPVW